MLLPIHTYNQITKYLLIIVILPSISSSATKEKNHKAPKNAKCMVLRNRESSSTVLDMSGMLTLLDQEL